MNARVTARRMALCCRRLAEQGLIAGQDGNLSVRLGVNRILVTPAGVRKADLAAAALVVVDRRGRRLSGGRKPTSELDLHLRILALRPDVQAVVHAHPPAATAFGVAGEGFMVPVLPELVILVGDVPLVPYGTPGTAELGDRVEAYIGRHDALLLANHGAVTVGRTLDEALIRMESLEHTARILLAARQLGRVTPLAPEAVHSLFALRRRREGHV